MKRLVFVVAILFLFAGVLQARIVYASFHGADFWPGSSTQICQLGHKALKKAGVKKVRVAIRSYKESICRKGEILILCGEKGWIFRKNIS